jgi:hypothetical protein
MIFRCRKTPVRDRKRCWFFRYRLVYFLIIEPVTINAHIRGRNHTADIG